MAEAISDRAVVAALRPFVRATGPVLDGLRDADPFGLRSRPAGTHPAANRRLQQRLLDRLTSMRVPGTAAWAAMDTAQRCDWWVGRVGRLTAALAAIPGIGGALADRLPLTDMLGAAGQGLVLCAIAGEHGIVDVETRVRLLAAVLFGRRIDPAVAAGALPDEQRRAEELVTGLRGSRPTPAMLAKALYRLGRGLWAVGDELERRPRGRLYQRALGTLPVVGMLGNYWGERSGLHGAARAGLRWIGREPRPVADR